MTQLSIAVGSQNPVKVNAALVGFQTMFPEKEFIAAGYHVESGVADQPMSCEETLQGATNRCESLKKQVQADFHVGIEGGIERIDGKLFANAWIVIMNPEGLRALGRSGSFMLPPKVQSLVEQGIELGHANDQVFSEHNSKHAGGAVGSLTGGVIGRQALYEHAMALALVAYKKPALFQIAR